MNSLPSGSGATTVEAAREQTKVRVETAFVVSGERERIKDLMSSRLRESGWAAEVRRLCRDHIKSRGFDSTVVEEMYQEVRGPARKAVPEEVKRELLDLVRAFVQKECDVEDL